MNYASLKRLRDRQRASIALCDSQPFSVVRYVYVIKIGPAYKIGLSCSPMHRVKSMQLPGEPDVLRIYSAPMAEKLERALHARFKDCREYGEWFLLGDAAMAEIDACVEEWRASARLR